MSDRYSIAVMAAAKHVQRLIDAACAEKDKQIAELKRDYTRAAGILHYVRQADVMQATAEYEREWENKEANNGH